MTPSLLRQWKRWESGEVTPSEFYQPIIAATFGTVTHAIFPVAATRDADATSWPSAAWTRWNSSAACSARTWTTPLSTVCGSWPIGCARTTRSCPATSF